jgi:hypothetical protein
LIDRLSHFAVFPSNEISKKSREGTGRSLRAQARKRKERKGRRGTNDDDTYDQKAALIQIDETQMS